MLEARNLHPERSLAQHYNPLAMAPALLKAHAQLDKVVDGVFGLKGGVTEVDRLAALFASYERLIAEGQLELPALKRRRQK